MDAAAALNPKILKAGFNRRLSAHGRAADDRRLLAQRRSQLDARIAECFASRDHGELRKAVELVSRHPGSALGIKAADLGAVVNFESYP